jgi:hypothetical protein
MLICSYSQIDLLKKQIFRYKKCRSLHTYFHFSFQYTFTKNKVVISWNFSQITKNLEKMNHLYLATTILVCEYFPQYSYKIIYEYCTILVYQYCQYIIKLYLIKYHGCLSLSFITKCYDEKIMRSTFRGE